jgi:hypothetical protein
MGTTEVVAMFQFLTVGPIVATDTRVWSNHMRIKRVDGHGPSTQAKAFLFSAQFQLFRQRQVTLIIVPAQISQQSTTLADQFE